MNSRIQKSTIRKYIIDNVNKNKKEYISLCIALFIGVILGVLLINNIKEEEKGEIQNYIQNFVQTIKNDAEIDKLSLLKETIGRNIFVGIMLWFLGSTVIGIPLVYAYVGYKGFCISYTVSSCIAILGQGKGILFSLSSILLQNIIEIPVILMLSVSGIKLYQSIMKDKRKENIKLEIIKHTIISFINILCLIVSAIIETYISTNILEIVIKYI